MQPRTYLSRRESTQGRAEHSAPLPAGQVVGDLVLNKIYRVTKFTELVGSHSEPSASEKWGEAARPPLSLGCLCKHRADTLAGVAQSQRKGETQGPSSSSSRSQEPTTLPSSARGGAPHVLEVGILQDSVWESSLLWWQRSVSVFTGHRCGRGLPCCWALHTLHPLSGAHRLCSATFAWPDPLACMPPRSPGSPDSSSLRSESDQMSALPEFEAPEGRPASALTTTVSLPGAQPAAWPNNHLNE